MQLWKVLKKYFRISANADAFLLNPLKFYNLCLVCDFYRAYDNLAFKLVVEVEGALSVKIDPILYLFSNFFSSELQSKLIEIAFIVAYLH